MESNGIIKARNSSSSTSAVPSSISSSGRRRKRPSEASVRHTEEPAVSKRQRTLEYDEPFTPFPDDDQPMPMDEAAGLEEDDKENVVEVSNLVRCVCEVLGVNIFSLQIHLSSRNNYAIPGSSVLNSTVVKREHSVKREPSPSAVKTEPSVKRESSPGDEQERIVEVRAWSNCGRFSRR